MSADCAWVSGDGCGPWAVFARVSPLTPKQTSRHRGRGTEYLRSRDRLRERSHKQSNTTDLTHLLTCSLEPNGKNSSRQGERETFTPLSLPTPNLRPPSFHPTLSDFGLCKSPRNGRPSQVVVKEVSACHTFCHFVVCLVGDTTAQSTITNPKSPNHKITT